MAKSQQTKRCSKCGEIKTAKNFSKSSRSKDGLQGYCVPCKNEYNFKDEVVQNRNVYNKDYSKADKDGIIYTITNPIGECYVGCTQRLPHLRWGAHKAAYIKQKGSFPSLHNSFDIWGIDAHEFKVIDSYENIDKIELREIESNMIKAYKLNDKSLNKNN